jgi:cytochrome c-type biogenesis protein CcmH
MVEKLATRMKEQPEDPTGWRLLARAYAAMGRFQESVAAFNEAAARGPEDASLLADWADALGMQNQSLEGEPSRLIGRALALDPNHPKGLSLAASAAFYRKDYDAAIAAWQKLQAQYPAGSEQANEVGGMIAEADAAKRGVPVAAASATNGTPPRANALPSGSASAASASPPPTGPARTSAADANVAPPGAGALSPGTAGTAADNASAITGNVSLDPKLRERTAPNDTLFIYARAASGPRMPLAILRTTARDLPRDFKLDDSMSMTPAARLSNATDVIVEARISKSGNATSTPGDLVGSSGSIKPGTRGLSLVINDVVR